MHKKRRLLLVDGYNVLNAWRRDLVLRSVDDARDEFTELLRDYAAYSDQKVVVVYDAYLADRMTRSEEKAGAFSLVFTRKGETADQFIEHYVDGLRKEIDLDRLEVRVATSDMVEQWVVLGRGATRVSARELLGEMEAVRRGGRESQPAAKPVRATVMERLSPEARRKLEQMRRGQT